MPVPTPAAYYVTTPDRIGWALLNGGGAAGATTVPLVFAGGRRALAALGLAWVLGGLAAMVAIVAGMGPAWLLLHLRNLRDPVAAAVTAGLVTLLLFTAPQLGGPGGGYRWASALASSLPPALVAAAIGALMQRVAYRRII